MLHRRRSAMAAALIVVTPVTLHVGASRAFAQADPLADFGDPVETVNAPYRSVPDDQRAELTLLPAIAAMDAVPEDAATFRDAVLLTPDLSMWSDADAWATGAAQRAALDAFMKVTELDATYAFALLYGSEHVGPELRDTELYPLLSEGRLLANAEMRHLDALDVLLILAAIEAERLASAGDTDAAIDRFIRGMRLARMVSDRSFFREKQWAMERMIQLMEAMRDVLFRYPEGATSEKLRDIVQRTDDDNLLVDRILLPEADRLAALQLVRETFERFGQPDPSRFGPTMAVVATVDQPLSRFGEASWWRRVGDEHSGYYDTIDAINGVFNDWTLRWSLSPWDPVLDESTDYDRLDPARHAAVSAVVPDFDELFYYRFLLRMEQHGTRTAFAAMGYWLDTGAYPRPLFAVRPRYIRALPLDPFDPREVDPFQYFVPIRDQPRGEREAPRPHQVLVLESIQLDRRAAEDTVDAVLASISDAELRTHRDGWAEVLTGIANATTFDVVAEQFRRAYEQSQRQRPVQEDEIDMAAVIVEALDRASQNRRFAAIAAVAERPRNLTEAQIREALRIIWDAAGEVDLERLLATERVENPSQIFTVDLDDSVFVLYSVGIDGEPGFAETGGIGGEDFLLWPPVISLQRSHLIDSGLLGD